MDSSNIKIYKVVFTPGRKPRKRDLSEGMLVPAKSKQAALNIIKGEFMNQGITDLKDKYFNVISMSTQEVLNSKEFKTFIANKKDKLDSRLLEVEESKPEPSSTRVSISEITSLNKFKNINVTMNGLFIDTIDLVGVNIFDMAKINTFKITPKGLEPTTVKAFDITGAVASFFLVRKQLIDNGNKLYLDRDIISVVNTDTGESKIINLGELELV